MPAGPIRPERLRPYDRRVPSRLEMAFSFGVVFIITLLGLLILLGAFGIHPSFRIPLGVVLVGYGVIRLLMLKSRFAQTDKRPLERTEHKEEGLQKLTKDDEKNLRNL